ncbi:hypothetical protein ACU4HD_47005 [Cupriavidus basilensis]
MRETLASEAERTAALAGVVMRLAGVSRPACAVGATSVSPSTWLRARPLLALIERAAALARHRTYAAGPERPDRRR